MPPFPRLFAENFTLGQVPTMADAQAISDSVFASFVAAECDKVRDGAPSLAHPQPSRSDERSPLPL